MVDQFQLPYLLIRHAMDLSSIGKRLIEEGRRIGLLSYSAFLAAPSGRAILFRISKIHIYASYLAPRQFTRNSLSIDPSSLSSPPSLDFQVLDHTLADFYSRNQAQYPIRLSLSTHEASAQATFPLPLSTSQITPLKIVTEPDARRGNNGHNQERQSDGLRS